jgi:valyl-tRNA synthetase
VHTYLEKYEFGLALQTIETLFWSDYCDNYIEIIKDQFFNKDAYSHEEINETLDTLYHAGLSILQLYAPYLPHITEKLYQRIYVHHEKIVSLHQTQLLAHKVIDAKNIHADMNVLLHIISEVRRLKTAAQIALKTPLQSLMIYNVDTQKDMLVAHEKIIKGISKAEHVSYHKEAAQSNLQGTEPSIIMYIHV